MKLLEVNGLQASIKTKWQTYHAIEDVTFSVEQGEILGIVGESGCGKSMTALSILRLVASPPVYITGGEIRYRGKNLLEMDEKEIRKIRGNKISMIFQEPMTSLNPVYTVGNQITEVIRLHQRVGRDEAKEQALQMLRESTESHGKYSQAFVRVHMYSYNPANTVFLYNPSIYAAAYSVFLHIALQTGGYPSRSC